MTDTPTPPATSLEEELKQLATAFTASLNTVMEHLQANPVAQSAFVPLGLAEHFISGLVHPALQEAARLALKGEHLMGSLFHLVPGTPAPAPVTTVTVTPAPVAPPSPAPVAPPSPAPMTAPPIFTAPQ
jgi:hypothetical protein